jgi:hypothetical protein
MHHGKGIGPPGHAPAEIAGALRDRAGRVLGRRGRPGLGACWPGAAGEASGPVVDLGAGWGYLSRAILRATASPRCTSSRPICARSGLRAPECRRPARASSTGPMPRAWAPRPAYDAVVTNPPFHIPGAAPTPPSAAPSCRRAALAPSGRLWLVANRHLPYERDAARAFPRGPRDRRATPPSRSSRGKAPSRRALKSLRLTHRRGGAMSFSIAGKTAIVTGAANGVGLAIGRHFADQGANVMFADMDEKRLVDESATRPGEDGNIRYFAGDLREKLTIANLLSATIDAFDRVDILVNAAARSCLGPARPRRRRGRRAAQPEPDAGAAPEPAGRAAHDRQAGGRARRRPGGRHHQPVLDRRAADPSRSAGLFGQPPPRSTR